MSESDRLKSIEHDISCIRDAIVKIAKVEVRQASHHEWLSSVVQRVDKIEADLVAIKLEQATKGVTVRFNARVVWVIVLAGLSLLMLSGGVK